MKYHSLTYVEEYSEREGLEKDLEMAPEKAFQAGVDILDGENAASRAV